MSIGLTALRIDNHPQEGGSVVLGSEKSDLVGFRQSFKIGSPQRCDGYVPTRNIKDCGRSGGVFLETWVAVAAVVDMAGRKSWSFK